MHKTSRLRPGLMILQVLSLAVACSTFSTAQKCTTCPPPDEAPRQCEITREFSLLSPTPGSIRSLSNPLSGNPQAPLQIVVLGDSVMWGNGLKPEHKFSYLLGQRLADLTGRPVQITAFAHSGARLYTVSNMNDVMHFFEDGGKKEFQGDLNSQRPTTVEQEMCATDKVPNAEVVLLDGCINDVGATDIALPPQINFTSKQKIAAKAQHCGTEMRDLLAKTLADFPTATVVVMNYYRIVSEHSSVNPHNWAAAQIPTTPLGQADAVTQLQVHVKAKQPFTEQEVNSKAPSVSLSPEQEKAQIHKWSFNSDAFLATSEDCFSWAILHVYDTSGGAAPPCEAQYPLPMHHPQAPTPVRVTSKSRIFLAVWEDNPSWAFGASEAHIWPVVPFGRKDEYYDERMNICDKVIAQEGLRGIKRDQFYLGCQVDPTAHPNLKGAQAYTDSLVTIFTTAWGK